MLCQAAIKKSTRKDYDSALKPYWDFCAMKDYDPIQASARRVLEYIWYLYTHTTNLSNAATKSVTALSHL